MTKYLYIFIAFALCYSTGCGETSGKRKMISAFNNEMLQRKIVRVNTGEINNYAYQLAKSTMDSLQIDTIKSCNLVYTGDMAIALKTKTDFAINSKMYKLFDAYEYNIANKYPLDDNLTNIYDSLLIYSHPVYDKSTKKLALWCISMRRKDIILYLAANKPDL
ncbi:MAG: hypothetical protein NW207_05945 [Cytophagales bacterium]|nr:hypothetical protein [Cytophagales bacterium]